MGLINSEIAVADGSLLPANASLQSLIESTELQNNPYIHYLDELEEEISLLREYLPNNKDVKESF